MHLCLSQCPMSGIKNYLLKHFSITVAKILVKEWRRAEDSLEVVLSFEH